MSQFNVDNSIPLNSSFLSFSHPRVTIYNGDHLEKKPASPVSSLYYYKIPYPTDNDTRLTYYDRGTPVLYKPKNLYLYGLLHNNITGLTTEKSDPNKNIIGETVIEYASSSTNSKLFLCVLLKKSSSSMYSTTGIDKLITMVITEKSDQEKYIRSIDLSFDRDLPKDQKCLLYKDNNNVVVVLLNPIVLSSGDVSTIISKLNPGTDLFNVSAPADYITTTVDAEQEEDYTAEEKPQESKEEIYIDCNPTNDDLRDATTYNLPIGTKLSNDIQKMDLMKTSMNFFVFIIGITFMYFTIPVTYKMLVIEKLTGFEDVNKANRIRSADILLSLGFILLILLFLYTGFIKPDGDTQTGITGIFVFIVFMLSITLIQFNKNSWLKGLPEANNKDVFTKDIWALIGSAFSFAYIFNGDLITFSGGSTLTILVLLIIATIVLTVLYFSDNKIFDKYFWIYGVIMIGIPLFMFLLT